MIPQHEGFVGIMGRVLGKVPTYSLGALMSIQDFTSLNLYELTCMSLKHHTLKYIF